MEFLKFEEQVNYTLRNLYRQYGYMQFKMSKFEPYDLYMQNKDFLISDGIITFTDTNGVLMALKPDVTLSIVKNYRKHVNAAQKVYYSENVYRKAGSGSPYREITQTGLECLGEVGPYEVCEVICLAARSLQKISYSYVLELSHLDLLSELLESLKLTQETEAMVLQAIGDKNLDLLEEACKTLPPEAQNTLRQLLKLKGKIELVVPQLRELFPMASCAEPISQLDQICRVLKAEGLASHVQIDFSVVNDLNYYNGIVFRGYIEGIPTGVLAGGQYDKLMEKMGKAASGIGFAVYVDQLERLDQRERRYDIENALLYQQKDPVELVMEAAGQLRAQGKCVVILRKLPDNLRFERIYRLKDGRLEQIE